MIKFIFSILLLSSVSLFGQNGTIRGTIIDDATGETVPFANVFVNETQTGTTSDLDGAFTLKLDPGTYTVEFSFIGYSTLNVSEVLVTADEITPLDVRMEEETAVLEEIVVTAKQIYSETKIGERALSIVSLAIRTMLEKIDGNGQKVLLIGSGETNQLVGKFLKKYKFSNIEIYNRTIDNAKTLAETLGASSLHLSQLSEARDFDIIIICTSANRVVIDLPLYQKMLSGDQSKKIIIDLAVPRNVGEDVVNYSNVDYIDIQNLKALAEENLAFRKAELSKARPIVQLQLQAFRKKLHLRQFEKAISKLPVELTHVKDRAINVVYKKRINELPAEAQELVVEMMDYMEKKCVASTIKLSREL